MFILYKRNELQSRGEERYLPDERVLFYNSGSSLSVWDLPSTMRLYDISSHTRDWYRNGKVCLRHIDDDEPIESCNDTGTTLV